MTGQWEQPVEIAGVEPIGQVGESDRSSALDARQQVDDPEGRERIAALADVRRIDLRVGQARGRRAQRAQADGDGGRVGHGQAISE